MKIVSYGDSFHEMLNIIFWEKNIIKLYTQQNEIKFLQFVRGRQHSFVDIDHEIFSTVTLSLPLIQEGQLSVSGETMCTILVNRLED